MKHSDAELGKLFNHFGFSARVSILSPLFYGHFSGRVRKSGFVSTGGLSVKHPIGFSGGIRYRYVHDRPANEDYSILAKGYGIVDMNLNYTYRSWTVGIAIENLLNSEWNETAKNLSEKRAKPKNVISNKLKEKERQKNLEISKLEGQIKGINFNINNKELSKKI